MSRLLCLAIVLILLAACSAPQTSYVPSLQNVPFKAEQWLAQLPEGEYAIGISYTDPNLGNTSDTMARDYAAVAMSRNRSSYVVDKEVILDLANAPDVDLTRMSFNVVVSADLDFLHSSARELKLCASYETAGYYIGLYSLNGYAVNTAGVVYMTENIPTWAQREGISLTGDKLYSVASSHQAELGDALNLAQEIALRQVAQYRLQNVLGKIKSIDDRVDQAIALETVIRSSNCRFNRIYIHQQKSGESSSYTVYVQLRSNK